MSEETFECKVCGEKFSTGKRLSDHIKYVHKIQITDYYVQYYCDGVVPCCLECGAPTRFASLTVGYKRYCYEHARLAMSAAGKIGGKNKPQWNKGLTVETDERIAAAVEKMHSGIKKQKQKKEKEPVAKKINEPTPLFLRQDSEPPRIAEYIESLGFNVVRNEELNVDVFVQANNVCFICHELVWRDGESNDVFDKRANRKKFELAVEKDVRLYQFFADEWFNRRKTCESIIKNALGINTLKLNARDCELVEVDKKIADEFVENHHVSGSTRCKHRFGLMHKEHGLVALVTTRVPIQKKHGNVVELARMCFKHDTSVRGGASKLLSKVKEIAIAEGYDGVLSYADCRFGQGKVYEKCGFALKACSMHNYWYTDGTRRFDRFKFRAQPGKSEREVAEENSVASVWGCGNMIYLWNKDQ